jgi:hypothetical protein
LALCWLSSGPEKVTVTATSRLGSAWSRLLVKAASKTFRVGSKVGMDNLLRK